MTEFYILKNVHELLVQGFSENELRQMCFYEADFNSLHNQLSQNAGKDTIAYQIIEYAYQKLKVDVLLNWANNRNPQRYDEHKPYYQSEDAKQVIPNFSLE